PVGSGAPALQVDTGLAAVIELARARAVPTLGLRSTMLEAEVVAAVRAAGLGIGGWACNDAPAIARMFELAVDVFTTDRPDLALAMRAGRGRLCGGLGMTWTAVLAGFPPCATAPT